MDIIKYEQKEVVIVDYKICNKCGNKIDLEKEDYFSAEEEWGFFSNKDGRIHKFDLCEKCYDEFVATFVHPVSVATYL